jgi:hypothetical protein
VVNAGLYLVKTKCFSAESLKLIKYYTPTIQAAVFAPVDIKMQELIFDLAVVQKLLDNPMQIMDYTKSSLSSASTQASSTYQL